jgi:hypothetical protein
MIPQEMAMAILPRCALASMCALAAGTVGEREHLVDDGPDAPLGEGGKQVRDECRHAGGALLGRAQLVGDTEEREALGVQRLDVHLRVELVVHVADGREPALEGHAADAFGEDRAADGIHDEVHALVLGRLHDRLAEIGRARAQAQVQSEGLQAGELLVGARRADHARAQRLRGLQRGHADAR